MNTIRIRRVQRCSNDRFVCVYLKGRELFASLLADTGAVLCVHALPEAADARVVTNADDWLAVREGTYMMGRCLDAMPTTSRASAVLGAISDMDVDAHALVPVGVGPMLRPPYAATIAATTGRGVLTATPASFDAMKPIVIDKERMSGRPYYTACGRFALSVSIEKPTGQGKRRKVTPLPNLSVYDVFEDTVEVVAKGMSRNVPLENAVEMHVIGPPANRELLLLMKDGTVGNLFFGNGRRESGGKRYVPVMTKGPYASVSVSPLYTAERPLFAGITLDGDVDVWCIDRVIMTESFSGGCARRADWTGDGMGIVYALQDPTNKSAPVYGQFSLPDLPTGGTSAPSASPEA